MRGETGEFGWLAGWGLGVRGASGERGAPALPELSCGTRPFPSTGPLPWHLLAQPLKQQRAESRQSKSLTPTLQQSDSCPLHWSRGGREARTGQEDSTAPATLRGEDCALVWDWETTSKGAFAATTGACWVGGSCLGALQHTARVPVVGFIQGMRLPLFLLSAGES